MWMMPLHLYINKKSDDGDECDDLKIIFLNSLQKHYVVGTKKHHLNVMVLFSTPNACFNCFFYFRKC